MCSSSFGRLSFGLKNAFLERPSRTGGAPGQGAHPAPYYQLPGTGREFKEEGQHRPEAVQSSRRSVGLSLEVPQQQPGGYQADCGGSGLHGE